VDECVRPADERVELCVGDVARQLEWCAAGGGPDRGSLARVDTGDDQAVRKSLLA
jgi:hypothetical protein